MQYIQKNRKYMILCVAIFLAYNLYFVCLVPSVQFHDVLYLDLLVLLFIVCFFLWDFLNWRKKKQKKEDLLTYEQDIIYELLGAFENREIVEHDVKVLQAQLSEQFEMNCSLQDYITKWCHEVKIPLSASWLITDKIKDANLRAAMKEQLERINQQLNGALLGCKVQSNLFDLQVKKVSLLDCVRTSVRNNQFFLIVKHFELNLDVDEKMSVYTDKAWLVYILDQLLNNAIKYAKEEKSILSIWSEWAGEVRKLYIQDWGEGIKECDIRRIFEKGFTGSNHHNGKYKSTGMGLYMADVIAKRLEHKLSVESKEGEWTRFCLEFCDNRDYLNR